MAVFKKILILYPIVLYSAFLISANNTQDPPQSAIYIMQRHDGVILAFFLMPHEDGGMRTNDGIELSRAIFSDIIFPKIADKIIQIKSDKLLNKIVSQCRIPQYQKELPALRGIKKNPSTISSPLTIEAGSIIGQPIQYYDSNTEVRPLSFEEAQRASNIDSRFQHENEYRIVLNTSSFLDRDGKNIEPLLHNLVKYLQLKCPSVSKYCQLIKE